MTQTGYRYGRVLIDASRILDSPFPDAVLWLSGAHLELLRNMAQYLNERTTFVDAYYPGYYELPSDTDWDAIRAIVADMEERLMGNDNVVIGYNDRFFETIDFTVTSSGTNVLQMIPVASEYVYFLQAVTTRNDDKVTTQTKALATASDQLVLDRVVNAAQDIWHTITLNNIALRQGDAFEGTFFGCDVDDVLHMKLWGFKMQVPA